MEGRMEEQNKTTKNFSKKNWTGYIFVLLIAVGTIGSILWPKRSYSPNENRFLQQMPSFTITTVLNGEFESKYETYITDQFLLRDQWIAFKTNVERLLQKKDINGVYFAKDDYLIERHEATEINKEQEQKNVERLAIFVENAVKLLGDDHVRVMLVPTASEILTDKLPAFASGYDQLAVIEQVKDLISSEYVVDVTETLKNHKDEYIYYKTDHHWTSLGAYYAYVEWAKSMGIEPLSQEEYTITKGSDKFYGTIASKVNVSVKPDDIYLYEKADHPSYEVEYNETETTDTLFHYESLETKDKYSVFLNGNNALVKITTENKNGRKLLVIKDSFSHCFVPLLVDHFEEVYMVDFRYYKMGASTIIAKEGITDTLVLYNVINFVEDKNSLMFER